MSFIGSLVIILLFTTLAGHLTARVGIPAVLGQLLIGIIIGPGVLNIIHPTDLIEQFAEIGVILLMFMAGIESDMQQLKKYFKPALAVALSGVLLPVIVMGTASFCFGYHFQEALFIGVVFSATSVSISVVVLREFKALNSKEGATVLGAAVADDILGVLLLSLMIAIVGSNSGTGGQESPNNILLQLVLQGLFFAGVFLLVRWIAPSIMYLSTKLLIPTSRTISAMIICLSMAYIAEVVGLSGAIGAFFAGIAVGQTPTKKIVNTNIEPISNAIFVPVFFVSIGLSVSFNNFLVSLPFIVIMTILAILTKWLGGEMGSLIAGFDRDSGRVIGTGMIARGEMALITAQIGFNAHLLDKNLYIDIIFVIVIATLLAPLLLRWSLRKLAKI
ncbi:MAG: cation:proton antiporter [Liquorilactobacillus hordei]|uniref:Periplasmic nitrate reductase NapA n=2 Tax=Liquorilactobacillus hordei TaxID=468911 RepID=A0A0R1MSF8_9LACO|nr:cation:proton antiporter [Liquorilactobacillus hordei]AUJ29773.1 sodium:proton antiporter [Liquorilactobacillus hordei]KRL06680.1 periplasmic nitrate reductase NapA [Liquorilactobacillus hordei DSM 19519]QYH52415.1 cation:proton antiporter [Liquorilactobacillus hordei DSM 19519]